MSTVDAPLALAPQARSIWSWLKIAAILLIILANVAYFGGNAALDLWQVAGPGTSFAGTIVGHEHIVTESEASDEYNIIKVDSNLGQLQLDVPDQIYNSTDVGQHVSGTLDARALFGHDQALRVLKVDGKNAMDANGNTENRILGQTFILLVVLGVGSLAVSLIVRDIRRRQAAPAGA